MCSLPNGGNVHAFAANATVAGDSPGSEPSRDHSAVMSPSRRTLKPRALGSVSRILAGGVAEPDLDRADVDGAAEDELAFVGAHRDRAEVLELVDRPLHRVPLLVALRVEARWRATGGALRGAGLLLIGLFRNRRLDAASMQASADLPVGVGLVAQQPV